MKLKIKVIKYIKQCVKNNKREKHLNFKCFKIQGTQTKACKKAFDIREIQLSKKSLILGFAQLRHIGKEIIFWI